MKYTQKIMIGSFILVVLGFFGARVFEPHAVHAQGVMYKSPTCGCCVQYQAYLKKQGIELEIEHVQDMQAQHDAMGIPQDMASCHIVVLDGYEIVGHIPIEAINTVSNESLQIQGIALPGMPAGSPGMPGVKRSPFSIYMIENGASSLFLNL